MFNTTAAYTELDTIHQRQNALVARLQQERTKAPQAIAAALNSGMEQLYGLAVFVNQNFNTKIRDMSPDPTSKVLFPSIRANFQHVHQITVGMFNELSHIQSEGLELKETRVTALQTEVQAARQFNMVILESLKQRISNASSQMEIWEKQVRVNEQILVAEEYKLRKDKEAQRDVNTGLSILFPAWGIAGLIDHRVSPGNIVLSGIVSAARHAVLDAQNTYILVRNSLIRARIKESDCMNQVERLDLLSGQLDALASALDLTAKNIQDMVHAIGKWKDNAMRMVELGDKMYNDAMIASGDAYFRDEFVVPILDICSLAASEPNSASNIESIIGELSRAYGGRIPSEVAGKFAEVQEKVKRLIK